MPIWSKSCTSTPPSPHHEKQLPHPSLWERPALVFTATELTIKVSPPTQGDSQPLPSHTPPRSFYQSCMPSLRSGGGSQRGKDFISLQHSSLCSWHHCQNLKVRAEFLREPAEGASSSHFHYSPVGKWMSPTHSSLIRSFWGLTAPPSSTRSSFLTGSWALPRAAADVQNAEGHQ